MSGGGSDPNSAFNWSDLKGDFAQSTWDLGGGELIHLSLGGDNAVIPGSSEEEEDW